MSRPSDQDPKPDVPSSQASPETHEADEAEVATTPDVEPALEAQAAPEAVAPQPAQAQAPDATLAKMEELMRQFQELELRKKEREEEERKQQSRILELEEMLRSLKSSQTKAPEVQATPAKVNIETPVAKVKITPEAETVPEVDLETASKVNTMVEVEAKPVTAAEIETEAEVVPQAETDTEKVPDIELEAAPELQITPEVEAVPEVEAQEAPEVEMQAQAWPKVNPFPKSGAQNSVAEAAPEVERTPLDTNDETTQHLSRMPKDLEVRQNMQQKLESEIPKLKTTSQGPNFQAKPKANTISKKPVQGGGARFLGEPSRLPRNVAAYYLQPLRREAEYGVPSCDLQLRSYSIRPMEFFCDFALRAAYYLGLPAYGPTPLPKIIERWTVPKSSFIFKKSQENFERITRRRLIQIRDGHPETVQIWLAFLQKHQQYGVGMKANIWEFSSLSKFMMPLLLWVLPGLYADLCTTDVGKSMDASMKAAEKAINPRFMHLGQTKSLGTVEKVDEILTNMRYKVTGGR